MNCGLSTNSLVDAISTRSCYIKNTSYETELTTALDNFQLSRASFLICLCSIAHAFAEGYQGYKSIFGFHATFDREIRQI